jgi:hypothetical protein
MKINCHHCNIEVDKNESEIARSERMGRKMFCSLSCSTKQQQKNRHAKYVNAYNAAPSLCEQCSNPLPYDKRKNRFCDRSCSATVSNSLFPRRKKIPMEEMRAKRISKKILIPIESIAARFCKQCNVELNKGTQTYFCCSHCSEENSRQKAIEKIKNGEKVGIRPLKKYIISQRGNECEDCGWDKINSVTGNCPIELEHIDGNSENNSVDNLKLLCPNCHSLTSTYKNLNKGNGRHSRRKRYAEGKSY